MYRICKSFRFETAHQLEHAFSKECQDCIHGHSYEVEVVVACETLDKDEMVLDFGRFKAFKAAVMEHWDHGVLLHENKRAAVEPLIHAGALKRDKVNFYEVQPTAEMMAHALYDTLKLFLAPELKHGLRIERIRVRETATGWAEYQP